MVGRINKHGTFLMPYNALVQPEDGAFQSLAFNWVVECFLIPERTLDATDTFSYCFAMTDSTFISIS